MYWDKNEPESQMTLVIPCQYEKKTLDTIFSNILYYRPDMSGSATARIWQILSIYTYIDDWSSNQLSPLQWSDIFGL